ncbi:MAG: SMI1/KNR4 family protein [Gammaproteobacteria bacterium]|nr:SMI1/KNR4 family protein [Gammaproteobacteria bacterium]
MEDIIEQLHEIAEETPVPLEEACFDDIVDAEEQILLPLSREFKTFLLECSHITYGRYEPVSVSDPSSHTYLPEVTANAWANGIPRDHVPLCEYGEDMFVIRPDGEVQLFIQFESVETYWPSIWHWVDEVWIQELAYK